MGATELERIRAIYDGFDRRDFNPFLELMHENVRWHLPGSSPFAGTTQSRDELVARLLQQSQASGGTVGVDWVDGVAHGSLVVVFERIRAIAGAASLDVGAVVVYRLEDGSVVEAWDVFEDAQAYDGFWATALAGDTPGSSAE